MEEVFKKLSVLLKERGLSKRWLCQEVGVSETGLKKMSDNASMKIGTLQKIADVLEVSPSYFLEETEQIDKKISKSSFGEKVLDELKHVMEEQKQEHDQRVEELRAQIEDLMSDKRFLQKIVEQHLGKLKGVGNSQFAPYIRELLTLQSCH